MISKWTEKLIVSADVLYPAVVSLSPLRTRVVEVS